MKKAMILLLLVAIGLGLYTPLFAQQYGVELSAFTTTINTSYFYYNRFENVHIYQDETGITHYRVGVYDVYHKAKKIENKAKKDGFVNAQIMQSHPVSLTRNGKVQDHPIFKESRLFLKTFRCENESVHINKEDRHHLEEIVQLMKDTPSLKLRVIRPSKPPNSVHHGRLKTISNFLMARGIAPYRMRITNTHHDFLTAIEELAASSSTPYLEDNQILITLINLKEEIIRNPTPPPSINELTTFRHLIKAVSF